MSFSSRRPTCVPTLALGTVPILSTIRRHVESKPLRSTMSRTTGIGWIGGEGANGDGVGRVETVIRARLACVILVAGDGPDLASSHSSSRPDTALMKA